MPLYNFLQVQIAERNSSSEGEYGENVKDGECENEERKKT
jgi:hypothetical protein